MTTLLVVGAAVVAGVVGLLVWRWPTAARALAVGSSGFIAMVTVGALWRTDTPTELTTPFGMEVGGLAIPLSLGTSRQVAALAAVVALVAAAVQLYSTWYLANDDRYGLFAGTVSLFTGAMLLVVHSRDLVLTLVGWEVMGWCSYLLIGHWSRRESARRAAVKAFLVTRVADVGFVLAVVGLAVGAGSSRLDEVIAVWAPGDGCEAAAGCVTPDPVLRSVVMILLVIGVLGKSAQVPFQDWLPDAMEGPTPASALIHAATMVAAGTVVLGGVFPVLVEAEAARWVLGVSSAISMVVAALLALGQSDLKRLLAWSTVSQVAIMLSALASAPGSSGPDAAWFHLWSHALFKSLLFLALGFLAVIAGGTTAVVLRGAAMRTRLGRWALLLGLLSLAGVPLVVGGVSKEHVVESVYGGAIHAGPGLLDLLALLVTIVLTAAYATRAYLVVAELIDIPAVLSAERAEARARRRLRQAAVGPQERGSPTVVLLTLSMLTLVGGLALPLGLFETGEGSWVWLVVTVLLIAVGCGLAFALGRDDDPAIRFVGRWGSVVDGGLGADRLYRALTNPVLALASVVAFLDREVIDAYVRGTAVITQLSGIVVTRTQARRPATQGLWLVGLGALLLLVVGVISWS